MLIEMLTLTGLRGAIVVGSLAIPSAFLFASIAVILPLFGGISVYGGASVLGVPFALALLGRNQVVVLSALSLIGAMGSYIPPVAFTPVVTAGPARRALHADRAPVPRTGGGGRDPRHDHPDLREPDRRFFGV